MEFNKEALNEFEKWSETNTVNNWNDVAEYMSQLLKAISKGGIKQISVNNETYEVYAELVETEY